MSDPLSRRHGHIVVMKFGGTSVATAEGRAAITARVTASLETGRRPVLVVSAMGRRGAPYATDTLLELIGGLPSDPRERDLIAGVGEVVSAVVVAHELRASGIAAAALTGPEAGIVTDGVHGDSSILRIHTQTLESLLSDGVVPVVCGFQGLSESGALTTLGRGGSDTTACALGVALHADEVEIYTDVDGVLTTDPRTCDSAVVLEVVRSDELLQMSKAGSKVVHTPAAELALESGLSVRVRNTYSDHPGTRVVDLTSYRPAAVATAVTHTEDVCRIVVELDAQEGTRAHMEGQTVLYRRLADTGASLDMFTPVGDSLVFTVSCGSLERAREVLDDGPWEYRVTVGLAKVTLVGAGMHGVPGVMARVAECLEAAGVPILQVADSHTTISVLVHGDHARDAVAALHDGFGLHGAIT